MNYQYPHVYDVAALSSHEILFSTSSGLHHLWTPSASDPHTKLSLEEEHNSFGGFICSTFLQQKRYLAGGMSSHRGVRIWETNNNRSLVSTLHVDDQVMVLCETTRGCGLVGGCVSGRLIHWTGSYGSGCAYQQHKSIDVSQQSNLLCCSTAQWDHCLQYFTRHNKPGYDFLVGHRERRSQGAAGLSNEHLQYCWDRARSAAEWLWRRNHQSLERGSWDEPTISVVVDTQPSYQTVIASQRRLVDDHLQSNEESMCHQNLEVYIH